MGGKAERFWVAVAGAAAAGEACRQRGDNFGDERREPSFLAGVKKMILFDHLKTAAIVDTLGALRRVRALFPRAQEHEGFDALGAGALVVGEEALHEAGAFPGGGRLAEAGAGAASRGEDEEGNGFDALHGYTEVEVV